MGWWVMHGSGVMYGLWGNVWIKSNIWMMGLMHGPMGVMFV